MCSTMTLPRATISGAWGRILGRAVRKFSVYPRGSGPVAWWK